MGNSNSSSLASLGGMQCQTLPIAHWRVVLGPTRTGRPCISCIVLALLLGPTSHSKSRRSDELLNVSKRYDYKLCILDVLDPCLPGMGAAKLVGNILRICYNEAGPIVEGGAFHSRPRACQFTIPHTSKHPGKLRF